ncbi:MAG TPA: cytochrome c biogenesis protein CcsA [Bacteroidia bacterium]|nr:cytochrome c biogenesis protein CcsA [Bacteroidia bacterium]
MQKNWWKLLASLLLLYTVIMGFAGEVPARDILNETIRNLYFHVPMWFGMISLLFISVIYGIRYLNKGKAEDDIYAREAAHTGVTMGMLGLITGSLWARYTWGTWWTPDTKLNGAAITMLIYFAYFILRGSVEDEQKKARLSAVYSIFAFVMMIVFVLILPRMEDSLHPGNGGNPGFSKYDLDSKMRMVFYPAVLGWILLGVWILNVRARLAKMEEIVLNNDLEMKEL